MKKIKLITETGQFVCNATIPVFQPMPGVVIWGSRVFAIDKSVDDQYKEVFTYAIPPGMESFEE